MLFGGAEDRLAPGCPLLYSRVPSPHMIGKHIALASIVGAALGLAIKRYLPSEWGAMQTAGLVLLIIGFTLWTVARFQLGSSFTVTAQPRQLVTHGLYSRIRNPISRYSAHA